MIETTLSPQHYRYSKSELKELLFDYNSHPGVLPENRPKNIEIWDETLRDGEQTPGVFLKLEDKIEIAQALNDIGTSKIAVGFPAVSPSELDIVRQINHIGLDHATILGIARPIISDIEKCLKCDLEEIVLFMPISDLHLKILNETRETQKTKIQEAVDYTRAHGLKFNWVAEDATRAHPDHLMDIFKIAIDNQAESIIIGDTVGVLQPESAIYLTKQVQQRFNLSSTPTKLGIHAHNDFGQAVANTVAAVFHGATIAHVCVNGYGERAGNAAFEEVVVNLEQNGINTGINMKELSHLSELVEQKFMLPLSAHKPIVGPNAFSHESGMHINAMLAHPIAYEPIAPKWVGQRRKIFLGKFSGSGSIINALITKLKLSNIELPKPVIQNIVQDLKNLQEQSSQDEQRQLFNQTKKLLQQLRPGIDDTDFFRIAKKHALKFLKGTWAAEK